MRTSSQPVSNFIQDLFEISNRFEGYLHKNIITDQEPTIHPELAQCTFQPTVCAQSVAIDRQQQAKLLAGKIVKNGARHSRVEAMLKKEEEKAKKLEAKRVD